MTFGRQGTILFSGNRVSWAPLTKSPPSKILRALVPRGDPIALKIFSDGLLVGPHSAYCRSKKAWLVPVVTGTFQKSSNIPKVSKFCFKWGEYPLSS